MTINGETIAAIIGIASLIGGLLAWWFAKVLSERKEDITQTLSIKHMAESIQMLQDDIKHIKIKVERIGIIEEKLRHLGKQ